MGIGTWRNDQSKGKRFGSRWKEASEATAEAVVHRLVFQCEKVGGEKQVGDHRFFFDSSSMMIGLPSSSTV